ncbi:hypothetical protein [Yoonia litorea]|uniref:Uncharacterized protein n=1 Tax=Yoonia litorea TaxID=1123755 RepID=A0A1I6MDT8_9RHOB|nr:hypothetical protein [Yoonia litorea]SFS13762.1 hypothetical protein SAMN05444714_1601 [Yoonia litorea]
MTEQSNRLDRIYAKMNPYQPETETVRKMFPRSEWCEGPTDFAAVVDSDAVLFCLKMRETGPSISVLLDATEARAIALRLQDAATCAVGMKLMDMATEGGE